MKYVREEFNILTAMPDIIVHTIYLMPQLLPVFPILRVDCLHASTACPKTLSRLLTVGQVVYVVLFIRCSHCTAQQNSKAEVASPHMVCLPCTGSSYTCTCI